MKDSDVIVTQPAANDEFSYLLEGEGVAFDIDGNKIGVTVDGRDASGFTLTDIADSIIIYPAHTFTLTANQDPDSPYIITYWFTHPHLQIRS